MAAGVGTKDYQRSQVALRAVVYSDTALVWRLLDAEKLDDTFPAFATAMLRVIEARRVTSSQLAARYLAVRRAGVSGSPPPVTIPALDKRVALVALRVMSVVTIKKAMTRGVPLERASRNALVRTMGVADKFVGDGGRELIRASVAADPAAKGWVRVTLGTCDYCASMAAGNHMHAGDADFPRHDHCGCQPEPQYEDALAPEEEYVEKILKGLKDGDLTEDQARALIANPATKPLSKVNLQEALDRFGVERARLDADAFFSREQYDAMMPDAAWSEQKRESILAALRETPEGRILADSLDKFQDGGSIGRLRSNIEKYLSGADLDPTSRARAEALINALRHAPTDRAPATLFRGMSVKGSQTAVLNRYKVGDPLDLNLTSFSSDRKIATSFQNMTGKSGSTRVMVEFQGSGKRAIPIQNLARDKRLFKEKEWVAGGRYEITAVKKSPSGGVILRIKQTGTL